nr:retrovirus-related Pol polyprotein from transposon TNT 1-94 [Tanacetum cinerariifolium]
MRVARINGKKYIMVIIDDYSRYTWTLFLRSKDETPEVLKDFLTMIQRNLQAPVITVRTDRGTKFLNETLNEFFKEEGTEHQNSTVRTPEQNDVVKRQKCSNLSTNIQSISAPSTHTNVNAEENNNDQAEEGEHIPDDEFTNPFCAPTPVQKRRQLATDPEMCMYALTVSTAESKNIKEAMSDSAQIEAMQDDLHQFDRLQDFRSTNPLVVSLSTRPDANPVGCTDSRKSTSGGIQFLEAEYVALSASCTQVMWMRTQLKDYGFSYNKIPLYCDSQSAIAISCNLVQHSRTKHIHTRYHFIKEHVKNGIIELYFVRTEYQLADTFTKALLEDRFKYLVRRI